MIKKSDIERDELVYYFSDRFLSELKTKSPDFQREFYNMVNAVGIYMDSEDEKQEFQQTIETHFSQNELENGCYTNRLHWSCDCVTEDVEKEFHEFLLHFYERLSSDGAVKCKPMIVVCVSVPDDYLSAEESAMLEEIVLFEMLFSLERESQGCPPVDVLVICNDASNGRGISCYVACLK